MTDYELMGAALAEAEKAAALGEVPVGAVIAKDGEIIAAAHNTRETEKNALHHAELLAIDAACKKLGLGDRPVCPAVQPPPGGGAGPPGRGSAGSFAGVFPPSAGAAGCKAEVETAGTGTKQVQMTKKVGTA